MDRLAAPPEPPPLRVDARAATAGVAKHEGIGDDELASRAGLNLRPGNDDGWDAPPPVTLEDGTVVRLYKDGEGLAAAYEVAQQATDRLLVESYIVANDDTGRAFVELLAEKAAAGVKVYLLYDSFGSLFTPRAWFEKIESAGGHVAEFHPVLPWRTRHAWRPGLRDHRKLIIVDDAFAGIGGLNLGTRYAGKWVARLAKFDPKTLWRDAGVGLTGPAVRQYIRCFARAWRHAQTGGPVRQTFFAGNLRLPRPAKGRRFGKARHYDPPRADEPADVLAPGHGHGLLAIAPSFMSVLRPALRLMFATCRRRAWLTMAYFAPDDGLIEAMCAAARRGVDVRLMLPQRGDPKVLAWAAQSFYSTLMAAGVRVFERREALLHQKSIVFDGNLTIIGSTNLDYRSIELNLESSAILQSPALARQMEQLFEHDMAFATEIDSATWRQRPLIDKFVQAVIYRVRYLL